MKKKVISIMLAVFMFTGAFIGCKKDKNGGDDNTGNELPVIETPVEETIVGAIDADMSNFDGKSVQNIKKFDNFTSTWGFTGDETGTVRSTSLNQVPALQEIAAEALRFDLFMGYYGLGYEIGRGGKKGETDAEYAQVRQLIDKLIEYNVNPYVAYFAGPEYTSGNNWKAVPDLEKWEELCGNIAAYFKAKGIRLAAHEIWNEPDFGTSFFSGNMLDYINMYIAGHKGIQAANPDAVIGGLAAAYIHNMVNKKVTRDDGLKTDFQRFIEMTDAAGTHPDFVSWHYYGRDTMISGREDGSENIEAYLNPIRNALNEWQNGTAEGAAKAHTYLETTQQHLNEFNIFKPSDDPVYMTNEMLPGVYNAIERLLLATDITRVMWASLLGERNDGLSYDLIDAMSLQRYPAYHALWTYARLPVDRVNVDLDIDGVKTMAGADSERSGLIVYNTGDAAKNFTVKLKNIPFDNADIKVYIIDEDNNTYITWNNPAVLAKKDNVSTQNLYINLKLKKNGAIYIEANKSGGSGQSDIEKYAKIGNIVRKDYYYFERGDEKPYSEIHENSLTAHVSMAAYAEGRSGAALTLDNMSSVNNLKVSYKTYGGVNNSVSAALGLKIDYQTDTGYSKSVFYNIGDMSADFAVPFGKKALADSVIKMGDTGSGEYTISLAGGAPANWTGRIVVSFVIKDAGQGATAKFILRK